MSLNTFVCRFNDSFELPLEINHQKSERDKVRKYSTTYAFNCKWMHRGDKADTLK